MTHQNVDRYPLRLPNGWRDEIKEMAAKNRRSMNQEILAALEVALPRLGQRDAEA